MPRTRKTQTIDPALIRRTTEIVYRYPRPAEDDEQRQAWCHTILKAILHLAKRKFGGDQTAAADYMESCVEKYIHWFQAEGRQPQCLMAPNRFLGQWVPGSCQELGRQSYAKYLTAQILKAPSPSAWVN